MVSVSCGGGNGHHPTASPTTAVAGAAAGGPGQTSPTAPGGSGGAGQKTTSTTANKAVTTIRPGAPQTTAANTAPSTGNSSGGPAPVAPGTYRYNQSGSFTVGGQTTQEPPQGTLVVDPPASNGTQVWHRYISPNQAPQDTTLLFTGSGMFIQSVVQSFNGLSLTCTLNPAVAAPPWPPAVGRNATGQGTCTGNFTANIQVTESITGTQAMTLDGTTANTFVVNSTIVITGTGTSSSLHATATEKDWFDPLRRLQLRTDTQLQGSFLTFQFHGNSSSTLASGKPS
jgi:hypothetical protein